MARATRHRAERDKRSETAWPANDAGHPRSYSPEGDRQKARCLGKHGSIHSVSPVYLPYETTRSILRALMLVSTSLNEDSRTVLQKLDRRLRRSRKDKSVSPIVIRPRARK